MTMTAFLEKLQSADNGTKRKWIIIATSISMVIIIYVWLAYFNTLFDKVSKPTATPTSQQQNTIAHVSIGDRLGSIYQLFMSKIEGFGNVLKTPREYIIKPNQK